MSNEQENMETSEAVSAEADLTEDRAVETAGADVVEPDSQGASEPEEDVLATALRECEELRDQLLRSRAEFDNYRKRMAREAEQTRKTASEALVRELLPVLDNLERALVHAEDPEGALAQGVGMVLKQLCDALAAKGLEPITSVGKVFDPNIHEALAQQPSDDAPADTVVSEFERGYRLNGFVIRPAKVVISSGPAQAESAAGDKQA